MSLSAITELMLHIEHFRNIDLMQQGLYFLKFHIYHQDKDFKYYAHPYHHESKTTESAESILYH